LAILGSNDPVQSVPVDASSPKQLKEETKQ